MRLHWSVPIPISLASAIWAAISGSPSMGLPYQRGTTPGTVESKILGLESG